MSVFGMFRERRDQLAAAEAESHSEGVSTADELLRLAESNEQVRAELDSFEARVRQIKTAAQIGGSATEDSQLIDRLAQQSADALSGYGITVEAPAFSAFADTVEPTSPAE